MTEKSSEPNPVIENLEHNAAGLILSICDALGFEDDHKDRIETAFYAKTRRKITFSEAREIVGIKDARTWKARCKFDSGLAAIEIMRDTPTTAFCWEDQVNGYLINTTNEPRGEQKLN